jgi:hypothetical protein
MPAAAPTVSPIAISPLNSASTKPKAPLTLGGRL